MKKSVKYGLYFVVVMPWMYLCIYGYYRLTKRYTDWWCEWEKNN